MRTRNRRIQIWLNDAEFDKFIRNTTGTGLSQEAYVRLLIDNCIPKEKPPLDYNLMIKELHYIGHNLNQIATKANITGNIDVAEYKHQAALLREAILHIRQAVEAPEKNE